MNIEHHTVELVRQVDDGLVGPKMLFISIHELILSRQTINRIRLIDFKYDAVQCERFNAFKWVFSALHCIHFIQTLKTKHPTTNYIESERERDRNEREGEWHWNEHFKWRENAFTLLIYLFSMLLGIALNLICYVIIVYFT